MLALATALFLSTAAPLEQSFVTQAQAPASIEVTLKGGKVAGERTIRVKRDDEVSLRINSDRTITLHLHGYDLERTAAPDAPAIFNFTARATGRFPMEEHISASGSDTGKASPGHAPAILYLEVLPK